MAGNRKIKYRTYLKCSGWEFRESRAGNNMLVVFFRDSANREYRHYLSYNKKSLVWLRQLLKGTGFKGDFEELELIYFVPILASTRFDNVLEYARDRLYEVVFIEDTYKSQLVVNELYNIDHGHNLEHIQDLYDKGWYFCINTGKKYFLHSKKETA